MKLHEYLDIAKLEEQIAEGNVNRNFHKKFTNLAIYTYSKQCTMDYAWNEITCKCRGLIVDTSTWEVIARPFEKFFNLGETAFPEYHRENLPEFAPVITDKLDGNLITLYPWRGTWYAASKGSFHSDHADWANTWLSKSDSEYTIKQWFWPEGYTPVFEMIAEELEHHVVHYGKEASGLYLLALVHIATGAELNSYSKKVWADRNDVIDVPVLDISVEKALVENEKNAEGYVLTWSRGFFKPPFKVKVKFVEFLRLQKLVPNIGPKEILDYMRHPHLQCYLDEVLNPEQSHEEFIKYTRAWMERITGEYKRIERLSTAEFFRVQVNVELKGADRSRKAYAQFVTNPEYCTYPAVMFAGMDLMETPKEDIEQRQFRKTRLADTIWKQLEPFVKGEDIHKVITQEE